MRSLMCVSKEVGIIQKHRNDLDTVCTTEVAKWMLTPVHDIKQKSGCHGIARMLALN